MKTKEKKKNAAFIATKFLAKCFNENLEALSLIISAYDIIKADGDATDDACHVLETALSDTRDFIQDILDDMKDEENS